MPFFKKSEMDCKDVRTHSSDYLDGDLPRTKMQVLRAHIDGCGPCRSFVDSLSSLIGLLTNSPKATAPPSFKESVLNRVAEEERSKDGKKR